MRILYLSQYFPPEIGATQTRAYEMAAGLVRAGHRVTMLTEVPNHPQGIIHPEYRGRVYYREHLDGIDVQRVWVFAAPSKTTRSRIAFYASFMVNAALMGLFLARGKFDLLYASSPPLTVGGAALLISALRKIPLVFEVRDLWPESAVELGELRGKRAIALATHMEELCYHRARHIVAATQGIRDTLIRRGCSPTKITLITNGANTLTYRPQPINRYLRTQLGIPEDAFVIIYVGLHGLAHGLDTALQTAELLRESAIQFLFVGDGPMKSALVDKATEMSLTNVRFHPAVPESDLSSLIATADVGLDTRRRISISRGTLPVKMFSYMACEKPVILCIEGEAAELVQDTETGLVVPPESPELLAEAILDLRANPELRAQLGRRGRALVEERFSRQALAARLEKLLREQVSTSAD